MNTYPEWQKAAREAAAQAEAERQDREDAKRKERDERHAPLLKQALAACGIEADPTGGCWEQDGYTFGLHKEGAHIGVRVYHNDLPDMAPVGWYDTIREVCAGHIDGSGEDQTFTPDEQLAARMGDALNEVDEVRERYIEFSLRKYQEQTKQETLQARLLGVLREIIAEEMGLC